ncbi:MAG: pyruvate ferredoxin oxidoreductase [Candidatus Hydrothermota bacterium]|nr:MAG: pyruvate ferredoxin oxidoreductase [Candidatus Hydrothermae bacterium]
MATKKARTLRDLARMKRALAPGHRACAGCPFPVILKILMSATDDPLVIANATGCMEVTSTIFPYTAWPVPWIHNAFENAAATISGVESAYKALKRRGKIKTEKEIKFIAIGGDGGTYDIGLQSLSGAIERGHDFLYILYNNEGYMNTGIQRSSATPMYASTTTSPAGKVIPGKLQWRKEITDIMIAHQAKYVAQASPSHWVDFMKKVQKALETKGPTFINVISPCQPGWNYPPDMSIELARLAVESKYWILYEYRSDANNGLGGYKINYRPRKEVSIVEFLKPQRRYRHILDRPELIKDIEDHIRRNWERLERLEKELPLEE